jgi:hypothetical protein
MTLIRPFLIISACCALLGGPANAATYNIDASVGGSTFHLPIPAGRSGYLSPIYSFAPGDTIDFGQITLHSFYFTPGPGVQDGLTSVYQISFSPIAPAATVLPTPLFFPVCGDPRFGACPPLPAPTTHRLLVTLPEDATHIQIAWFGVVDYAPAAAPIETTLPAAAFLFASVLFGSYGARRLAKRRTPRRLRPIRRSFELDSHRTSDFLTHCP